MRPRGASGAGRAPPARSPPDDSVDAADLFEELKRLDVFIAEQHK